MTAPAPELEALRRENARPRAIGVRQDLDGGKKQKIRSQGLSVS
jgi:hypothetical protein